VSIFFHFYHAFATNTKDQVLPQKESVEGSCCLCLMGMMFFFLMGASCYVSEEGNQGRMNS